MPWPKIAAAGHNARSASATRADVTSGPHRELGFASPVVPNASASGRIASAGMMDCTFSKIASATRNPAAANITKRRFDLSPALMSVSSRAEKTRLAAIISGRRMRKPSAKPLENAKATPDSIAICQTPSQRRTSAIKVMTQTMPTSSDKTRPACTSCCHTASYSFKLVVTGSCSNRETGTNPIAWRPLIQSPSITRPIRPGYTKNSWGSPELNSKAS